MTNETTGPELSYRPTPEMLSTALSIIIDELTPEAWSDALRRAACYGACEVDEADYTAVEAWERRTNQHFAWPAYYRAIADQRVPVVDGTTPGDTTGFGLFATNWAARIAVDYVDAVE